ncbi:MAG: DUF1559 domain-containing protein [Pirellulales bacterium]
MITRHGCHAGHHHRAVRPAFTLVELLVVIGIIGVLLALLLPAVQHAREAGRRTTCLGNLKQIGAAAQLCHNTHGRFPASTGTWESWTWGFKLLPFLDQKPLADAWNRKGDFLTAANLPLAARPISVFKCPSALSDNVYTYGSSGSEQLFGTIDYKGCQSVNASDAAFAHWKRVNWLDGVVSRRCIGSAAIRDGLSNTFLIVESVGGKQHYTRGGCEFARIPQIWFNTDGGWAGRALSGMGPAWQGALIGEPSCTINCINMYDAGPYSFHPHGVCVVLCDGSTHFLAEETDVRIVGAMYCYFEGAPDTL